MNATNDAVIFVQGRGGLFRSTNQGDSFQADTVLQALLTRSATYPWTATYTGGAAQLEGDVAGHNVRATQGRKLTTLADVNGDMFDNFRLVAASAFGELFFQDTRIGVWQDLSAYLPRRITAISSAVIDHDGVYVSLEGRGVWRIENPEFAAIATFFEPATASLGRLRAANGSDVGSMIVEVVIREPQVCTHPAPDCAPIRTIVTTAADGSVPLPSGVAPGRVSGRVVDLVFAGVANLAPSRRTFTR